MSGWGILLGIVALVVVDVIVALGWTTDSRDETYSLGRVMRPRRSSTDSDPDAPRETR